MPFSPHLIPAKCIESIDPFISVLGSPPAAPSVGDRYLVDSGATGDFAGHDNEIAQWDGAAWGFEDKDLYPNSQIVYGKQPQEAWFFWHEKQKFERLDEGFLKKSDLLEADFTIANATDLGDFPIQLVNGSILLAVRETEAISGLSDRFSGVLNAMSVAERQAAYDTASYTEDANITPLTPAQYLDFNRLASAYIATQEAARGTAAWDWGGLRASAAQNFDFAVQYPDKAFDGDADTFMRMTSASWQQVSFHWATTRKIRGFRAIISQGNRITDDAPGTTFGLGGPDMWQEGIETPADADTVKSFSGVSGTVTLKGWDTDVAGTDTTFTGFASVSRTQVNEVETFIESPFQWVFGTNTPTEEQTIEITEAIADELSLNPGLYRMGLNDGTVAPILTPIEGAIPQMVNAGSTFEPTSFTATELTRIKDEAATNTLGLSDEKLRQRFRTDLPIVIGYQWEVGTAASFAAIATTEEADDLLDTPTFVWNSGSVASVLTAPEIAGTPANFVQEDGTLALTIDVEPDTLVSFVLRQLPDDSYVLGQLPTATGDAPAATVGRGSALPADNSAFSTFILNGHAILPNATYSWSQTAGQWVEGYEASIESSAVLDDRKIIGGWEYVNVQDGAAFVWLKYGAVSLDPQLTTTRVLSSFSFDTVSGGGNGWRQWNLAKLYDIDDNAYDGSQFKLIGSTETLDLFNQSSMATWEFEYTGIVPLNGAIAFEVSGRPDWPTSGISNLKFKFTDGSKSTFLTSATRVQGLRKIPIPATVFVGTAETNIDKTKSHTSLNQSFATLGTELIDGDSITDWVKAVSGRNVIATITEGTETYSAAIAALGDVTTPKATNLKISKLDGSEISYTGAEADDIVVPVGNITYAIKEIAPDTLHLIEFVASASIDPDSGKYVSHLIAEVPALYRSNIYPDGTVIPVDGIGDNTATDWFVIHVPAGERVTVGTITTPAVEISARDYSFVLVDNGVIQQTNLADPPITTGYYLDGTTPHIVYSTAAFPDGVVITIATDSGARELRLSNNNGVVPLREIAPDGTFTETPNPGGSAPYPIALNPNSIYQVWRKGSSLNVREIGNSIGAIKNLPEYVVAPTITLEPYNDGKSGVDGKTYFLDAATITDITLSDPSTTIDVNNGVYRWVVSMDWAVHKERATPLNLNTGTATLINPNDLPDGGNESLSIVYSAAGFPGESVTESVKIVSSGDVQISQVLETFVTKTTAKASAVRIFQSDGSDVSADGLLAGIYRKETDGGDPIFVG